MNLSELNFELPRELIAQRPLEQRDGSRMLLLERFSGKWDDRRFRELPDLLRGDELIVFNNTRVIPARLFGRRMGLHASSPGEHSPAKHEHLQTEIEVLLMRQVVADTWEALVRPGRKIPVGGAHRFRRRRTRRPGRKPRRFRLARHSFFVKERIP
jgi:S-adenosylmethionine:tRNA ribosyltransferase-isomerase